jgi:hypothetical protein
VLFRSKSFKYFGFEWEFPDLGFIKFDFTMNGLE